MTTSKPAPAGTVPVIQRFRFRPTDLQREHRKNVLQEARKNTQISQCKFAEKIGRKYSYVARRESGFDYMTIDDVLAWAAGCEIDAVALFAQLIQQPKQPELQVEAQSCQT